MDVRDPVRRLLDESAIRRVIHQRARTTDDRDLAGSLACYHAGATEKHEGFDGPVTDYLESHSPAFDQEGGVVVCHHLIGNIEIEFARDRASVSSYFVCHLTVEEDGGPVHYINAGRYLDRFVEREGRWAIQRRVCVYDWSRRDVATPPWWESPRSGESGARVAQTASG